MRSAGFGDAARRAGRRIGRRGTFLLFLALLDLVYGAGLTGHLVLSNAIYRFAAEVMPLNAWAGLWIFVGLVCAVQAVMVRDQVAFAAATLLKVFWGGLSLIGWIGGEVPRGYVSAVIWLAFGAVVFLVSGWVENWAQNGGRRE